MTEAQMMTVRGDIGMLFQESALFDSLTVAETSATGCTRKPTCRPTRSPSRQGGLGFVGLEGGH